MPTPPSASRGSRVTGEVPRLSQPSARPRRLRAGPFVTRGSDDAFAPLAHVTRECTGHGR